MIIAVDFDGTYAADPVTFAKVVENFLDAGHEVILVTNRGPEWHEDVDELVTNNIPKLYAGSSSKRSYVAQHGYDVDIWIDDMPHIIDVNGLQYVGEKRGLRWEGFVGVPLKK